MAVHRYNISIIIALISLFSVQAYSQQIDIGSSPLEDNAAKVIRKPVLNYMIGSNFLAIPHLGSVTALTISPSLSVPLSPKFSVHGGITAGYYYSAPWKSNSDGLSYGTFTALSVYGAASYNINPKLTLYGSAIKQLAGTSPFSVLPKTSYSIGSTYNFGNFSIGVSVQTSKWDDLYNSPFPVNGSNGFYTPFERTWMNR